MTSLKNYTQYPAIITECPDGFDVEVVGRHTCGTTREEAIEMAEALVVDNAETLMYLRRRIPEATDLPESNLTVGISPTTAMKIMLWNSCMEAPLSKQEKKSYDCSSNCSLRFESCPAGIALPAGLLFLSIAADSSAKSISPPLNKK